MDSTGAERAQAKAQEAAATDSPGFVSGTETDMADYPRTVEAQVDSPKDIEEEEVDLVESPVSEQADPVQMFDSPTSELEDPLQQEPTIMDSPVSEAEELPIR
jgi:hypothetical protein